MKSFFIFCFFFVLQQRKIVSNLFLFLCSLHVHILLFFFFNSFFIWIFLSVVSACFTTFLFSLHLISLHTLTITYINMWNIYRKRTFQSHLIWCSCCAHCFHNNNNKIIFFSIFIGTHSNQTVNVFVFKIIILF